MAASNKKPGSASNYLWIIPIIALIAIMLYVTSSVNDSIVTQNIAARSAPRLLITAVNNSACASLISPASGSNYYSYGTTIILYASSAQLGPYKCTFVRWQGSGTNSYSGTQNQRTITTDYNKAETAYYVVSAITTTPTTTIRVTTTNTITTTIRTTTIQSKYSVTMVPNPKAGESPSSQIYIPGGASVSGAGNLTLSGIASGSAVCLSAQPVSGYTFAGYTNFPADTQVGGKCGANYGFIVTEFEIGGVNWNAPSNTI